MGKIDYTACPFCGQSFTCDEGLGEKERLQAAVEKCECLDARRQRDEQRLLFEAQMKFDSLLLYKLGSEQEGEILSTETREQLKELFEKMPSEIIGISLKLSSGDKVTVKRIGFGEKFEFSRSKTDKIKS